MLLTLGGQRGPAPSYEEAMKAIAEALGLLK